MAKKSETSALNEHQKENRNAVILGFLLAAIPLILFFVALVSGPTCLSPSYSPCGIAHGASAQEQTASNGTITDMASCIDGGLCNLKVLLYGVFPTFYTFFCLPLGALSYIIDMKFNPEKKFKLKLLGKSLFIGGILGIVITTLIIPLLVKSLL